MIATTTAAAAELMAEVETLHPTSTNKKENHARRIWATLALSVFVMTVLHDLYHRTNHQDMDRGFLWKRVMTGLSSPPPGLDLLSKDAATVAAGVPEGGLLSPTTHRAPTVVLVSNKPSPSKGNRADKSLSSANNTLSKQGLVRVPMQSLIKSPFVLIELGILVIFHTTLGGIPLISKLGLLLKRLRIIGFMPLFKSAARHSRGLQRLSLLSTRLLRVMTRFTNRIWKAFGTVYSKTSLSKIVQRSKKMIKIFLLHDNEEHEHGNE